MAELEPLRLFVDVVRCRSFSRAADLHGVTQSAASQRVSHLEKSLGLKLLDRSVRPPALTEAGRVYFDGCTEVVGRYDRLGEQLAELRAGGGRAVRVAAIYSSGIGWLGRVRAAFLEASKAEPAAGVAHAALDVDLAYDTPAAVHRAVMDGAADVGIVSFPRLFEGVTHRALREEEMVVVCSAGHALSREPAVSARHLGGLEMLAFDPRLPIGRATGEYLGRHGVSPRVAIRFDNLDTLKSTVAGSGCFAILPRRTVAAEVQQGRLSAVTLRPTFSRPVALVFKRGVEVPPAVERFAAFVLAHAEMDAFAEAPHARTPSQQPPGLPTPRVPRATDAA